MRARWGRRVWSGLLAGSTIGLALVLALPLGLGMAASPASGTLSYAAPSLTWTGSGLAGSAASRRQVTCNANPNACDNFKLTVDTHQGGQLNHDAVVALSLTPSTGAQISIILYPPGCSPALTTSAACYSVYGNNAKLLDPANGDYTVQAACTACAGASYSASASLGTLAGKLPAAGDQSPGWAISKLPYPDPAKPPAFGEPNLLMNSSGVGIANTFGPTVWITRDRGLHYSNAQVVDTTGCPYADADAVVAEDNTLYADHLCYGGGTNLVYTSRDYGKTWGGPYTANTNSDRQWLAADPTRPGWVYLSWHDLQGPNISFQKSTDYGQTWSAPVTVVHTNNNNQLNPDTPAIAEGNHSYRPLIDRLHDQIYVMYTYTNLQCSVADCSSGDHDISQMWFGVSGDGGATFTQRRVIDADTAFPLANPAKDNTVDHNFSTTAIDARGNLYVLFSLRLGSTTETHLYLTTSSDQAQHWTAPVRVDSGDLNSSVFPWLAVGDPGRIAIAWYGTTAHSFNDPNGVWAEMEAESINALSASPTFVQSRIGQRPVHLADICQQGLFCTVTGGDRNLSDFQGIAIDPCGYANPVWTDDSSGQGFTVTARQTGGTRLVASGGPCTLPNAAAPSPPPRGTTLPLTSGRGGSGDSWALILAGLLPLVAAVAAALRRRPRGPAGDGADY